MIAFHFPPFSGSSGVQRTLRFCQYLPDFGWEPVVLTADPVAYETQSHDLVSSLPEDLRVYRAFARDTARHLAVRGRYLDAMALPDRWVSWILGALPLGLRLIRQYRPDVIWSTYPIATAHLVGCALKRLGRLPWVADFRDPMVEFNEREGYWAPRQRAMRRSRLFTERQAVRHAERLVFCTNGARRIVEDRYDELCASRCAVIGNGYDEVAIAAAEAAVRERTPRRDDDRLVLLHSGVLYATPDRDPRHFMEALRRLLDADGTGARRFKVVLRGAGHETLYRSYIDELNLQGVVSLKPPIEHAAALQEMIEADALLVFQGYTSNPAIPAKIYEYIRIGKPILAMVDEEGDTARLLSEIGMNHRAPLDDAGKIAAMLRDFFEQAERSAPAISPPEAVHGYSRYEKARELARLLDSF